MFKAQFVLWFAEIFLYQKCSTVALAVPPKVSAESLNMWTLLPYRLNNEMSLLAYDARCAQPFGRF